MKRTTYQVPELRDANDNIIQQGAFGKNTALCTATNDGWIDYVANNLEFLYDIAKDEVVPVPSLPASGQMNKTYLLTTTGVSYRWSGTAWVEISSSEAVGRAEAAAQTATTAMNETKRQAQQAAASIAEASALVDKTEKNSAIVRDQLQQAQALATASAGIQIYLDDDGDLAYRMIE